MLSLDEVNISKIKLSKIVWEVVFIYMLEPTDKYIDYYALYKNTWLNR